MEASVISLLLGDCIVHSANDRCGLDSVPLICKRVDGVLQSTTCLCSSGLRRNKNDTCLGKYPDR